MPLSLCTISTLFPETARKICDLSAFANIIGNTRGMKSGVSPNPHNLFGFQRNKKKDSMRATSTFLPKNDSTLNNLKYMLRVSGEKMETRQQLLSGYMFTIMYRNSLCYSDQISILVSLADVFTELNVLYCKVGKLGARQQKESGEGQKITSDT